MGAHMYADRCAGARQGCGLRVYSPASWEGRIRGSQEWIWGQRGARLGHAWVLFFFEKTWWALFFLIGLDLPFLGGGAAVAEPRRVSRARGPFRLSEGLAVARELAVRSWPHSMGALALHLMRSGCLSHPGAPAAR